MVTIGHSSWARGLTIRHLDLALFVSLVTNGDLPRIRVAKPVRRKSRPGRQSRVNLYLKTILTRAYTSLVSLRTLARLCEVI